MRTICTNLECLQEYQVKPEALGKLARCPQCNSVFKVEEFHDSTKAYELIADEDDQSLDSTEVVAEASMEAEPTQSATQTVKRKTREIIEARIRNIRIEAKKVIPLLESSYNRGNNESDTRLIIDSMLKDILGYQIDDIRTEQKVNGRRADYVLSVNGEDCIVIEAKAITNCLKPNHIYQATAYGAYAGIKWVILTNGIVWMLYRITTGEKLGHELIFTVSLLDGLDEEEAEHFYLISRDGMCRKHLLEKRWQKIWALNPDNLREALLSEEVVSKVRTTLTKQTGYRVTNEELKQVLISRAMLG